MPPAKKQEKQEKEKKVNPRWAAEEKRKTIENRINTKYENRGGGVFVMVEGKRVPHHEITSSEDRAKLGLPELPKEE